MLTLQVTKSCAAPNIFAKHPVLGFSIQLDDVVTDQGRQLLTLLTKRLDKKARVPKAISEMDEGEKLTTIAGVFIHSFFSDLGGKHDLFHWQKREDGTGTDFLLGVEELVECVKWARNLMYGMNYRPEFEDLLAPYQQTCQNWLEKYRLNTVSEFIVNAAERQGVPWRRLSHPAHYLMFGYGKSRQLVNRTLSNRTGVISDRVSENKYLTQQVLKQQGVPASESRLVTTLAQMEKAANDIGYPVVVKPLDSMRKQGVTLNIKSASGLKSAMEAAAEYSNHFNVEKFIPGKDHRILVINGECVAVVEKTPASVVGDGKSTISELMEQKNQSLPARLDTEFSLQSLKETPEKEKFLAAQGLDFGHVPEKGATVMLDDLPQLSEGGDCRDVLDITHAANKQIAIQAAQAMQMDIAALDFLCQDISRPYWETGARFVEVNSLPGLRALIAPNLDRYEEIGDLFLSAFIGENPQAHVDVFVCVGDKSDQVANGILIQQEQAGKTCGIKTNERFELDGCRLLVNGPSISERSNTLLWHPGAESVILQESFEEIERWGLGYTYLDHLYVCSIPKTEKELAALNLLVETTVSSITINAEDPDCIAWAASLSPRRTIDIITKVLLDRSDI